MSGRKVRGLGLTVGLLGGRVPGKALMEGMRRGRARTVVRRVHSEYIVLAG